jgi:hypothetical protein
VPAGTDPLSPENVLWFGVGPLTGSYARDIRVYVYDGKMHPVPFAESIPFIDNPVVFAFFKNVVGIWNPWVMGSRYTVFQVPVRDGGDVSFGVPICFEDAFLTSAFFSNSSTWKGSRIGMDTSRCPSSTSALKRSAR